ncbi:hypothetical protein LZ618_02400 [Aeromonas allosaccharophila]|nr:hypothetical protein [Aeromonas allosaccharophila]
MRAFLERNKIYFETITPSLISIIALVISLSSLNMTKRQIEISTSDAQPHFYIKEYYLYDSDLKLAYETELKTFNSGADITNYEDTLRTVASIEFYSENGKETIHIPLNGYYGGSTKTQNSKGEMTKYIGPNNNILFSKINDDLNSVTFRDKYGFAFISLKHAVRISYKNKLSNEGYAYFINTKSVSKEEYESFMNVFNKSSYVDFSKLTTDVIGGAIEKARTSTINNM